MTKTMNAASHPSIANGKKAEANHESRTATAQAVTAQSWARHIIDFDAADPATYSPHSLPMAELMRATARSPIPWPKGKEPTPAPFAPSSITRRRPSRV